MDGRKGRRYGRVMKTIFTLIAAYLMVLMPLLIGGCAKSESSAIGTSEMVPTYIVSGKNGKITCQAIFQVGGTLGTYLELSEGEKVFCSDGETSIELRKEDSIFNTVSYYANTDLKYEVGRDYSITFERKDGTRLVSTVTLPDEVIISAPVTGQIARKGEKLPVRWNRGKGSTMEVRLAWNGSNGTNASNQRTTEDSGAFNFIDEETQVRGTDGKVVAGDVSTSVEVTRVNRKGVSPKFRTGTIAGKQSQTVRFTLID